jgi:TatD DNase family protein
MVLIDTHCHINFGQFDEDRDAVMQRAAERNVTMLINPAVDVESSYAGIALSQQYEGVYAAVGVHPNSTANFEDSIIQTLRELAIESPKVVAIGEIGLDYYWDKSPKSAQQHAFEAQLNLATELELPVIIHNRDAHDDVIRILESWASTLPDSLKNRAGVLHSFSAPPEIAERALAVGLYLGFTGPLTFKKAEDLRQIARSVPLDRLLIETDAPYLTPEPYRGKRNEPAYVYHVADRLAALHAMPTEKMADITTENAKRLFRL